MEQTTKKEGIFTRIENYILRNWVGILFVSPVLIGIIFFTFFPMLSSLYYSFFEYDGITDPIWNNFYNFIRPFSDDWETFSKSVSVTFTYSIISIPLNMILSYLLALFLNQKVKGMKFFRLLYYLPVLIPGVIYGFLWRDFVNVDYGLANQILRALHLPESLFIAGKDSAMATVIFLNLFGLGGGMVLWLASLKGIPQELYESANLEGANYFQKLFKITIPMCTPMIFYNLIMGIIGSLQTFGNIFVLTGGSPGVENSLLFYVMNVYYAAFSGNTEMGYASALSWLLFIMIGLLSLVVFKTSKWVFYGEDV